MEAMSYAWSAMTTTPAFFAALGGVAWGMLGGALPGISPSIAMALLLPFTYPMDPIPAIVLLASTYVGAEYGGSIPAILIRTPGTNAAAATAIDGYEMQKMGRGGEALGISLVAGVIGGMIGIICLILLTRPLANVALYFTPPAYFSLGILGLSVIASLSSGSLIKGLMAGIIGLMIATVGTDPLSGVNRFTYGTPELLGGIPFILIMVGVFAVSELLVQAGSPVAITTEKRQMSIRLPNRAMMRRLFKPQMIGSGIGAFEGCMPGAGGSIAAFMSYNEARRWSKYPEEFGKGSPEAIAAPEAANNTVAGTALVPMLSFGIPGSNSTADSARWSVDTRPATRTIAVCAASGFHLWIVCRAGRGKPLPVLHRYHHSYACDMAGKPTKTLSDCSNICTDLFGHLLDRQFPSSICTWCLQPVQRAT